MRLVSNNTDLEGEGGYCARRRRVNDELALEQMGERSAPADISNIEEDHREALGVPPMHEEERLIAYLVGLAVCGWLLAIAEFCSFIVAIPWRSAP